MPNEREAMTLKEVSDKLRLLAPTLAATASKVDVVVRLERQEILARQLIACADAIDAHLSRAAEPVAVAYLERLVAGYPTTAFPPSHPNAAGMGKLYTHPSEDARDTARLEWLAAHPRLSTIVVNGVPAECYFYGMAGAMGLKLREVIDAAMAKENGNG